MSKSEIYRIEYESDMGNPACAQLGLNSVTKIIEHRPQDVGDKWFWDIFTGDDWVRLFSIRQTYHRKIEVTP